MHLLLTDVLSCPRCGPELGLVLLANRIDDRRVIDGKLGCANCRELYPIEDGAADLRTVSLPAHGPPAGDAAEEAVKLAALLGLAEVERGTVLLAGPGAALAPQVAALVPDVEVVALAPAPAPGPEAAGVSRVAAGPGFPFRANTLRGVALAGGADEGAMDEALRVAAAGARLVVDGAPDGAAGFLQERGAKIILDQEGTVVARAPGAPVALRRNAVR